MATKLKLAGVQRAQMIEYIRRPMRAWLREHMRASFPDPTASEAHDITAEAAGLAIKDILGADALRVMAQDIIEGKKK